MGWGTAQSCGISSDGYTKMLDYRKCSGVNIVNMKNEVTIKTFNQLTTSELYALLKARFEVFVMEQHCFYLDLDDIDYKAVHIFVKEENDVIAYSRLFPDNIAPVFAVTRSDDANAWHIGRLLTVKRGQGLGRLMMETILQVAAQLKATTLRMEAQTYAVGLYEKFGFKVISAPFDEAGVMHVEMEKHLQ
jgi:ElaA protein